MSKREIDIQNFLARHGWGHAQRRAVLGDASTRHYERLKQNGQKAVLMNAPKGAESPAEPEGASPDERRNLGYNALARLAGPNMESFCALSEALVSRGFSAPRILAADIHEGLILLEDLGEALFARVIVDAPHCEGELYEAAIDTLAALYRSSFPNILPLKDTFWRVRDYDETALLAEVDLFLDWYVKDLGRDVSADARAEWYDIWRAALAHLNAHAPGLALRDFHAENIFWLPERDATARIGLIDFQDALFVHPSYDLVSLLEDARRDVSPHIVPGLIRRFCEKAGVAHTAEFDAAYAVMGAQRNTKVIAFPVRADILFGKPQYRVLMPRVQAHLLRNLAHPALGDLKAWYTQYVPEVFALQDQL